MLRPASLALAVALGGCFLYSEPIVQRPSIDIVPESSAPVYRGDTVTYDAVGTDPQHKPIAFSWTVLACVDGTNQETCDPAGPIPQLSVCDATCKFSVPDTFQDLTTPVQAVRILVGARDTAGATTSGDQVLVVPVGDHPPTLTLRPDSRHGFVVNAPMAIYAKVGDPADGPSTVTLQWSVFTPTASAMYTLDDLAVTNPCDATSCQYGKTFLPNATGSWTIRAIASDPLLTSTMSDANIVVSPDHPPCLAQLTPIVPPTGNTLPITSATLFIVDTVTDDLDPYPPTPSDPVTGVTQFQWSIEQPGGSTHTAIPGGTSNNQSLDPSTYNPGDVVELRVEIYDRNHTTIPCADGMATCSIGSDASCLQRQTWRVEMQ